MARTVRVEENLNDRITLELLRARCRQTHFAHLGQSIKTSLSQGDRLFDHRVRRGLGSKPIHIEEPINDGAGLFPTVREGLTGAMACMSVEPITSSVHCCLASGILELNWVRC
jgi:hypothetical protein